MIVIGLTGSIGMGKSVLASQFRRLRIPVHDADATVHQLLSTQGGAYQHVIEKFPDTLENGQINRQKLGQIVFNDPENRRILENIIHPLVRQSSKMFIAHMKRAGHKICVLDIPLLFETGRNKEVDYVLVTTAPSFVQTRRVMARDGMTQEKFKAIVKAQMPDYHKRINADMVLNSARGKRHTLIELETLIHHA